MAGPNHRFDITDRVLMRSRKRLLPFFQRFYIWRFQSRRKLANDDRMFFLLVLSEFNLIQNAQRHVWAVVKLHALPSLFPLFFQCMGKTTRICTMIEMITAFVLVSP